MIRRHLVVHGMVQGVGYRWSVSREARRLGLAGWVRNRSDGTVEAVAQGPDDAVEALVDWCRTGPAGAQVSRVDVTDQPPEQLTGFQIEP